MTRNEVLRRLQQTQDFLWTARENPQIRDEFLILAIDNLVDVCTRLAADMED